MAKFYTQYSLSESSVGKIISMCKFVFNKRPKRFHVTWQFGHELDFEPPGSKYVTVIPYEDIRASFIAQGMRVVVIDGFKVYTKQMTNDRFLHITVSFSRSAVETNKIWENEKPPSWGKIISGVFKNFMRGNVFQAEKTIVRY